MNAQPDQTTTVENEEFVIPPVNICESKDEIILEAEMPGVDKNRLEVTAHGGELSIIGRRVKEEKPIEAVYAEIPQHDYRRVFSLGDHINQTKIQAAFSNGILTLRLAKAEEAKPRRIDVDCK